MSESADNPPPVGSGQSLGARAASRDPRGNGHPPRAPEARSSGESVSSAGVPALAGSTGLGADLVREIVARAEVMAPDVIEVRRHLHRHPEPSEQEFQTTEYLSRLVESLGLHANVCDSRTGLTCDFVSRAAGTRGVQRMVLRGDIDALPIDDGKAVEYRSMRQGYMHACGHDAHPAIVYGALRLLVSLDRDGLLPWPMAVRGVFQPAEEVSTGAKTMIRNHALKNVSAALALHVDPSRPVGRIGLRVGTLTASCDSFRVDVVGRGGHGARPHLTQDPIEAAAAWILAAYRRVPRTIDAHHPVVLSVGNIQGGHVANVIPDTATIHGTLRTLTRQSRRDALEAVEDINESIRRQSGCEISIAITQASPAVDNDAGMVRLLSDVAEQALGADHIDWIPAPSMGSEDFSYYLDHVPGAMFRLGVAGDQVGQAPLHTPQFDIDERALSVGARLFASAAIEYFIRNPAASEVPVD